MVYALALLPFLIFTLQKPMLVQNAGFETGLDGWRVEGNVSPETAHPIKGSGSAYFGPGKGALRQNYKVPGLRILWFGATLKPNAATTDAQVRLECFDQHGHRLVNLTSKPDKDGIASIYLKTHAFTDHVTLSIEKGTQGTMLADEVILTDDDKDRVEHVPQIDLNRAMTPAWQGSSVYEESVLLLSHDGKPASGRLLFTPTRIVSVKDTTLGHSYVEGQDFTVDGKTLVAVHGSKIPTMATSEFPAGQFPWPRFDGRHIFVTYEHADNWTGPIPTDQSDRLPRTCDALRRKKPLTIVAFGDSITLGINVSGFRNVPPYMPPWPTLVAEHLKKVWSDPKVTLYNVGLGGMTSEWAKENARDQVASLHPHLVLISFGMNDFWSITPAEFKANIEAAMANIRAKCPHCEFILISPMRFYPEYTHEAVYVDNFNGYEQVYRDLQGLGVALVDMTAMSQALYAAKSQPDLATDPMHPDDFLARWYAQSVVATVGH